MSTRRSVRFGGIIAGAALAAAALAIPATAASAVPNQATAEASECQVTGGTMKWGVKESFRSYISGSIANGSWETSDGLVYETPQFTWSDATGSIDPETGIGSVSFIGTVHFTGHDGVLDLTLANPTIEFEGAGKAALMLDAKSTDMEGEVTVDSAQEWVGEVSTPASLAPTNDTLTLERMETVLTNSGAGAFAGFYEAGAELDALSLDLELASCSTAAAVPAEPIETEESAAEPAAPVAEAPQVPWLPIIVGSVALVVIALTTGILIGGRKKRPAEHNAPGAETTQPED
ncbi:HtaA domain-containing protein [Leucobacter sp. BZR 635]